MNTRLEVNTSFRPTFNHKNRPGLVLVPLLVVRSGVLVVVTGVKSVVAASVMFCVQVGVVKVAVREMFSSVEF